MGTPTRTSKRLALEGPPTPLAAGEAAARSPLGAPSACPLLSLPTDLLEACLSTPGPAFLGPGCARMLHNPKAAGRGEGRGCRGWGVIQQCLACRGRTWNCWKDAGNPGRLGVSPACHGQACNGATSRQGLRVPACGAWLRRRRCCGTAGGGGARPHASRRRPRTAYAGPAAGAAGAAGAHIGGPCHRRPLQDCRLWRREWERVYGPAGPLQEAAVRCARALLLCAARPCARAPYPSHSAAPMAVSARTRAACRRRPLQARGFVEGAVWVAAHRAQGGRPVAQALAARGAGVG